LGAVFTDAVQTVLDELTMPPDRYAEVWGDVREAMVNGFPYCIY
jgi:hypothetical protein